MAGSCFLWLWERLLVTLVLVIQARRRAWRAIDGQHFQHLEGLQYRFSNVTLFFLWYILVVIIVLVPKSKAEAEASSICKTIVIPTN